MDPVEDHLHDHVIPGQRRARQAGVAVPEGSHRVEDVRHCACPPVEGPHGLLGRRVGVTARDGHAGEEQPVDQLVRAGKLGREGHHAHRAGAEQPLEQCRIRIPPSGERVDPETVFRQERPLEMNAEDARAADAGRHVAQRCQELLLGRRDERRQVRRDAALEQRLACTAIAVRVGAHQVDACEAVDLEIDEPRNGDPASVGA